MFARLFAIVIVAFALSACGQKGPLVLPPAEPAATSTTP
jgi:predicted small lipoprotein YifL